MYASGHGSQTHSTFWPRSLDGQTEFEICIPSSTSPPPRPNVVGILLGGSSLAEHQAPVWSPLGAENILSGGRCTSLGHGT